MAEKNVSKVKKMLSVLRESLKQASSGCGPDCGCHFEDEPKSASTATAEETSGQEE